MGALERLKNKLGENEYTSNFNFAKCEMSNEDIAFIKNKEKRLFGTYKKLSENMRQICEDLYEVSLKFKASGNFMEWYQANGMNKDTVSRILKRRSLYVEFPDYTSKISSFNETEIKMLTHKDVTYDDREAIITAKEILTSDDIKTLLLPCVEKNKKEFEKEKKKKEIPFNNKFSFRVYKDFKKKIKISENLSDLTNVKSEISDLKKALAELEAEITAREKAEENKNNLKII